MKKINSQHKWYVKRKQRKRMRRALKSKRKRCAGICNAPILLNAPEEFGLIAIYTRSMLLRFLRNLEWRTLVERRRVFIDFSQTRKMNADGTLLFKAELGRIYHTKYARGLVRCNYPVNNKVEQVLQHLGLLKMMNCKGRATITDDDVRYWRAVTDTDVVGAHAEPFVEEYRKSFPNRDSMKFYGGLVEAITNCKQHAYAKTRHDLTGVPIGTRWWMFQQVKDGSHTVAVCDLGMGIKRSLLEGTKWGIATICDILEKFGLSHRDSDYIKAAMELGRTRTNEVHRGKGLQDIRNVIDSVGEGVIYILSNQGMYSYSPTKSPPESTMTYRDTILGTLIMWQIPINKGE